MKKLASITLLGLFIGAMGCGPSAQTGNTQSAPPKAGDPASPGGTPPAGDPAAPAGAAPAAATP
jgi:hypothetical protein